MKLYELTNAYQEVLELIEEGNEEYLDTLESIKEDIEQKAENTAKVLKTIEAQIEVIRQEEKRLANRRKELENSVTRIKQYLENNLREVGMKKIKGNIFTISIQKNPPSVEVINENLIPEKYMVIKPPEPNKKEILNALKNGEQIDGVELKQTESLRIR